MVLEKEMNLMKALKDCQMMKEGSEKKSEENSDDQVQEIVTLRKGFPPQYDEKDENADNRTVKMQSLKGERREGR